MNKKQIIDKLREDDHYYGDFGKKYLSNSDIRTLLTNPLALGGSSKPSSALLIGGYFHTAILEPHKLKNYKVIPSSTRSTKMYKEMSGGELCLLQKEVDNAERLAEKVLSNNLCKDLIRKGDVIYEEPAIKEINGYMWKGKADIINHSEKLIVDLKTTSDIHTFSSSAWKYNYDSQAYIYSELFGYELIFIVVDKNTHQIGLFDCSSEFIERGIEKARKATEVYELFYNTEGFDKEQYSIVKTL